MFGSKKCSACGNKIEKKWSYCPYCSFSLKKKRYEEDFGLLGSEDDFIPAELQGVNLKGMDKLMNSLMKQLDKELSDGRGFSQPGVPMGFKIQISTGNPQIKRIGQAQEEKKIKKEKQYIPENISEEEMERRMNLPRENAVSSVKRLSDKIIYEIDVPGIKSKKDIVVTKMENSIEIKAFSKDKCYIKTIPMIVEILAISLKDEKLFLELKS